MKSVQDRIKELRRDREKMDNTVLKTAELLDRMPNGRTKKKLQTSVLDALISFLFGR